MEPDICKPKEEARQKSVILNERGVILTTKEEGSPRITKDPSSLRFPQNDTNKYPIYFFGSDTSGEKTIEEFFTEKKEQDIETIINLGVVKIQKRVVCRRLMRFSTARTTCLNRTM